MSKKKRDIPQFGQPIIETHCHLDYLEGDALDDAIASAQSVGVERIVSIAVSPGNLAKVRELTQHESIWGTQGIHPHEAEAFNDDTASEIRAHCSDDKIVAVGEIGLDYYYDHADRAIQKVVFERQLQLAVDLDLPVVIHTRDADEDTRAILSNFSRHLRKKGVIHSFTSGLALAEYCLSERFMLGFNGIITFNRADNVREVLSATPMAQLVVETDAPYLTPVPNRGRPNEPKYLPFIIEKIAQVKGISIDDVLTQTYSNAQQLFWV
jgi:TatD DNase family protein